MTPRSPLWRPGCPFCALLLRGLARTGLRLDRIDIWDEPAAAAWLRVVADGNETVPTVHIVGGDPDAAVALVNPSLTQVLAAVDRVAPSALPGTPRPSGLARILGGVRGRRDRDRGPAAPR